MRFAAPNKAGIFFSRSPLACGAASLIGGTLLLSGCQMPAPPTGPTEIVLHIPDYDAFVDASLSVLRRHDFPPEYVDRTRGLIISHPTTSRQWFEPWRVDSQGGYQLLESSLHTMRRVVNVKLEPLDTDAGAGLEPVRSAGTEPGRYISPGAAVGERGVPDVTVETQPATAATEADEAGGAAPGARYRMVVRVDKSRYSAPERQITTASGALAIYSERIPTTEGLRAARTRGARWVPLGRDPLLEAFILAELTNAAPDVEVVE